jgi:hypothetical protein
MAENTEELQELYVLVGRNAEGKEGVASYVDPRDGVMKPALGGKGKASELMMIGQALEKESGLKLTVTRWVRTHNYLSMEDLEKET